MTLADYDQHPCPECGHKIGLHSDSPFGTNPEWIHPLTGKTLECGRSHHSLVIDKLTAWWEDALNERDILQKKLDIALDAIDYAMNHDDSNTVFMTIYENCKDSLAQIEKIK